MRKEFERKLDEVLRKFQQQTLFVSKQPISFKKVRFMYMTHRAAKIAILDNIRGTISKVVFFPNQLEKDKIYLLEQFKDEEADQRIISAIFKKKK